MAISSPASSSAPPLQDKKQQKTKRSNSTASSSVEDDSTKPTSASGNGNTANTTSTTNSNTTKFVERPFPWNTFSDTTYKIAGCIILVMIIIPSMAVIALSNIVGYALQYSLYDKNPAGKRVLEYVRNIQRSTCQLIGYYILLDVRDASYLGWMVWGNVVQPLLFVWAYRRYQKNNGLEIGVFLLYHLLRVGPRHQLFAHHATLVHKEGHATRMGLFCNPITLLLRGKRQPISKPVRRCLTDHVVAGVAGILYGTIPNHYATAHNKIHHRWHNDTGDVHTNMDLDRTCLISYLMYLPRFVGYWTGITPAILFAYRGEYKLLMDLAFGMVYYYAIGFLIWYKAGSIVFYWAYFLYPMLEGASFLGIIAYLWHSFSEEDDPSNQYINSITILRGGNNVWNEDYHVVHHHEPGVHWTDMPRSFETNLEKYVSCRATVFGDCEQGMLIAWIFGSDWDTLTDYFVDLQYVFSNGDCNKDPALRMTVKQIAEFELERQRSLQQQEEEEEEVQEQLLEEKKDGQDTTTTKISYKTTEEIKSHHQDVKTMLLRRLRYHYMGTRKDEEGGEQNYNARLSANVRDWDDNTESVDIKKKN